jgi:hypothetical protein
LRRKRANRRNEVGRVALKPDFGRVAQARAPTLDANPGSRDSILPGESSSSTDTDARNRAILPLRKSVFLPFALLDLDVMTVVYSLSRNDDVFHVEHFCLKELGVI